MLFFLLCCSILAITRRQIETLAGVYTLSFLGVMALFAIGNMLLKVKRDRLPSAVRAGWITVVAALLAVCVGLLGNLLQLDRGRRGLCRKAPPPDRVAAALAGRCARQGRLQRGVEQVLNLFHPSLLLWQFGQRL